MHRDSDHFKKLKALNKDVEMLYDIDSDARSKAQSDTLCNPGDVLVKHKDGKTVFEANRGKNTTNYGVWWISNGFHVSVLLDTRRPSTH